MAAGLKLLIPFVIVIPGIIAFNLFSGEMEANAGNVMAVYEQAAATPHQGDTILSWIHVGQWLIQRRRPRSLVLTHWLQIGLAGCGENCGVESV